VPLTFSLLLSKSILQVCGKGHLPLPRLCVEKMYTGSLCRYPCFVENPSLSEWHVPVEKAWPRPTTTGCLLYRQHELYSIHISLWVSAPQAVPSHACVMCRALLWTLHRIILWTVPYEHKLLNKCKVQCVLCQEVKNRAIQYITAQNRNSNL
jgi:hypothetical protein